MSAARALRHAALGLAFATLVAPRAAGAQAIGGAALAARRSTPPRATYEDPEQLLVELRLGHVAASTVLAFRVDDEALLPVGELLALAQVRFRQTPDGVVEGTMQPGAVRLTIAAASDTMRLGRRAVLVAPAQRLFRDGELYVPARALGELLGIRFIVNWADLAITVENPDVFPVAQRTRRDRERVAMGERTATASGPRRTRPADRPVLDGLVLDYFLSTPSQEPVKGTGYGLSAGANVLGGSLEGVVSGNGAGQAHAQGSWTGVWRDQRWLRQLRLGDIAATGAQSRQIRGLALTNSPFVRPSAFSVLPFPGDLPPGWAVDVYRGGELIGFDSVDATGRFQLNLPVQYGDNPVDFVAYGPYGEERRLSSLYRVRGDQIPPGATEYGLSGGRCGGGAVCAAAANLDLRRGVTQRVTLRGGVDRFWRDTLPGLTHPYVGVTGSVTNAIGFTGDAVARALLHGGVSWEPNSDLRLGADYTRYDASVQAPVLSPAGWRGRALVTGFYRPRAIGATQTYLEANAERVTLGSGTLDRARLALSWQKGMARVVPYVRAEHDAASRQLGGATLFLLPSPRFGRALRGTWLRAGAEGQAGRGFSQAALTVSRPILPMLQLEATALRIRATPGTTFALTLTTVHRAVRAYTTVSAPTAGRATATQMVQGSLLLDPSERRVALSAGPSLQRAGAAGHVFLDANDNGRRDPDEQAIPGVYVRVGPSGAITDSAGAFAVWDVIPFEPIPLQIDSLTLPSPLWVPARVGEWLELSPNRYLPLDIPVLAGGTVDGRVWRVDASGGRRPLPGARVVLHDRRTGARKTATSFSDGTFSALALRPGTWEATIDSTTQAALGARAGLVRFAVRAMADGDQVEGIELTLVPVPDTARADGAAAGAAPVVAAPVDTLDLTVAPDVPAIAPLGIRPIVAPLVPLPPVGQVPSWRPGEGPKARPAPAPAPRRAAAPKPAAKKAAAAPAARRPAATTRRPRAR